MRWMSHSRLLALVGAAALSPGLACAPVAPPVDAGPQEPDPPVDAGQPAPVDSGPAPVEDAGPTPPPAECGNAIVEQGEQCDDGNQVQTDACKNNCTWNRCGDNYLYEGEEACDDGNTQNGDGCSAVCLEEPPPVPPYTTLQGMIRDRKYLAAPPYQGNVTVKAVNTYGCQNNPTCTSGPSAATGEYVLPGLPTQSALVLQLRYNETYGPNNTPVPPGFTTRVRANTQDQQTQDQNLYVVKYSWLTQAAVDCGVYANLETSVGNGDFIVYSAVFGQLKDAQGNGVAGINKNRLEVDLGGFINDTVERNPNYFCWLQPYDHDQDANTPDIYRGTTSTASYAEGGGAFVIFKVTNKATAGTGAGTQYVRVKYDQFGTNFAEQSVPVQAGNVSVVTLTTDANVEPPPIEGLVDFNTRIYPIFTTYGCTACHQPGAPAAILDFTAQPDDVYNALVAPSTLCGPPTDPNNPRDANPAPYRVCSDYPKRAKLATYPLLEDPPNHPNASFPDDDDPTLRLLEAWMEQGAPRYAEPQVPLYEQVDLATVMETAVATGCTNCHTYNASQYLGNFGNLALDGCIQGLDVNGDSINDYEAAGIDLNSETNPDYKRDCVEYQLAAEAVVGNSPNSGLVRDPYGHGYRVNPAYPEQSMLLGYPACTYGGENPCNGHPAYLFTSTTDGPYVYFQRWIEGLANPPSDPPPDPPAGN